ncbi:cyclin-like protein [Crepidotus variabilis]|uniref:Cyclin-like protein n=1 Tax=Crepidotus variabilis TaxID=179855 RepID=A0A9P6ENV7_9AGAR|nr:cyclin-like protein [Crepidotus variabilis]
MATNHARLPQRRALAQRTKVDENAMSRHSRQPSNSGTTGPIRFSAKENALKTTTTAATRHVLGEVTMAAVNRKDTGLTKPGTGKDIKEEIGMKRGRSDSNTLAQRVPLGPGRGQVAPPVANAVHAARVPLVRNRLPVSTAPRRVSRVIQEQIREEQQQIVNVKEEDFQSEMEVELDEEPLRDYDDEDQLVNEREVEAMIGIDESEAEEEHDDEDPGVPPSSSVARPQRVWPEVDTDRAQRIRKEVDAVREVFEDEVDMYDTTMVSEYAEEIFEYMSQLEEEVMPNANYMDGQNEVTWPMRQTLVDWLLQVHLRYHMLPETLWIAVNVVDRFLTKRVVSVQKLQLVGVTAMFIAAKYEEILAPSVDEFVFMTENAFGKEEILKGERIMLQSLEFRISHYCSPYSWMRKISKADDYDIQTRTLSKFLTEVTLLDHRFLGVKPSLVAAVGMYTARKMLGGDWNDAFVFYSGFTEEYLIPGHNLLVDKLAEEGFHRQYVCKKYANKKFLKASVFAIEWAKSQLVGTDGMAEGMVLAE